MKRIPYATKRLMNERSLHKNKQRITKKNETKSERIGLEMKREDSWNDVKR